MFPRLISLGLLFSSICLGFPAVDLRRNTLDDLLKVLPKSEPFEQWLQKTGELPPDFSTLPSRPFPPELLAGLKSASDWPRHREERLKAFQQHVTGTIPPAPGNTRVAEEKVIEEAGVRIHQLLLEFGPDHRAKLHAEVIVPKGKGPFPVFITQDTHRRWALIAASRGYIACVYAGADSNDDTADWVSVWPKHDWTKLTRRAWAASRCIDYLHTRSDVNRAQISLTGHSRNGKTSMIAAAFDERIKAVISSSSGAGGPLSYRFVSERQAAESVEFTTRAFPDWLHQRLRFYTGREDKLPVDMTEFVAAVAPRSFLFATALNDNVESVWAIEQSYYAAQRVYDLLGAKPNIALLYREGIHGTDANDIERYLDWVDAQFGRRERCETSDPIYPTYGDWQKAASEKIDPLTFSRASSETPRHTNQQILKMVRWALGEEPPLAASTPGWYGANSHVAYMLGRTSVPSGLRRLGTNFGNYISGDLWWPNNSGEKLPAIIWLHPVSVATGYVPAYRRGDPPHITLARAGFAVFAFDQIGNGNRVEEIKGFYERYPKWSLLGRTVADTRAALDVLQTVPFVDTNRIWLVGFENGGSAALHVAALDRRVAGVVAVGGFAPMRPALPNRGVPLAAHWQQWLPMMPRLGAFVGHEDRIPYDYRELVQTIAPRKALLIAPRIDEQVDAQAMVRHYESAGNARVLVADDYSRFGPEMQSFVIEKLKAELGAP